MARFIRFLGVEGLEARQMLSAMLLHTLNNPTPAEHDQFGDSVAIFGNTIVVGAVSDEDAGSAYLFDATSGALLHTLNNPTPEAGDGFGHSVAISGNTIVVGASRDNTGVQDAGSAYLFDATSGALLHTLNNPTPPTPPSYDGFGLSVAISGNTIVVGAGFDHDIAFRAGSAYLFDATSGALLHTLYNPSAWPSIDQFGWDVAISGNTIVVGARRDDTGAWDAGSAYLFDATSGALLHTLNNPTPEESDLFGDSVAISGNTIVVGAPIYFAPATDAGSAYLFDATSGALRHTLDNPTPEDGDRFGHSVAISGNTIVVGASGDNTGATNAGSAYLFDATSGALLHTLNNPTPEESDLFGDSVAISGNTIVVGAFLDDTGATNAGSAYVFSAVSPDFNEDGLYDCLDIDALVAEIVAGTHNTSFDLTGDGLVDPTDRDAWLALAGHMNLGPGKSYLLGDATLDGIVDGLDFIAWNDNKFTYLAEWCAGDFTADGIVDGLDYIEWSNNKFQSSDGVTQIVLPEPHKIDDTRHTKVNNDTIVSASSVSPRLVPLVAKRVDSVFATSRRGKDHEDERPEADSFENFGDALAINPYLF